MPRSESRRTALPVAMLVTVCSLSGFVFGQAGLGSKSSGQDETKKKPTNQRPGAGKILGLPSPKADKARRNRRLVLPPQLQKPKLQEKTAAAVDPDGSLADFMASLLSDKKLTTAELVAEYSLLGESERGRLRMRAHRLEARAIGRLARIYRAIPDREGVPSLLTVLRSRKIGRHTRRVVENAMFLSGEKGTLVGLDLLTSKYKGVRDAAADFLGRMIEDRDLPQLRMLIDHKEQGTRITALRVLAKWIADNPTADDAMLLRCLRHRDGAIRTAAARHLRDGKDSVTERLVPLVSGLPEDRSFFLAALLLAHREMVRDRDLLPKSSLQHLARHRFGSEPMERAVAFIAAAIRTFRDPDGFRKNGGALAAMSSDELMKELIGVAQVRGFYPEFPICHEMALLSLRLLTGEDFGADHRRWQAWWTETEKNGFEPLRRRVEIDSVLAPASRITLISGDRAELVMLGKDAKEPAKALGGFRCRLGADELVQLGKQLEEQGLFDLRLRLREVASYTEGHAVLVETPNGSARDGFVNRRSLRLRVFQSVLEKVAARESWQEFVPRNLDHDGRREWWLVQRAELAKRTGESAKRQYVLELALAVLPTLPKDARRRAIGRFLEEAGRKDGQLTASHAQSLLGFVESNALDKDEHQGVFEVLALIKGGSFERVLTAVAKSRSAADTALLRRILALAGTDRLLVALQHENPNVRATAAGEIAHVGNAKTIPVLLERLADDDFAVRARATESCGRLRLGQARPRIKELLKDTNLAVRQSALLALARIGGDDTYEILLQAAGHENVNERLTAVHGLTILDDARSGAQLVELAAQHYEKPIGMMAMRGLRRRGGKELRAKVWKLLQISDNQKVRREFTFLLGEMGDPGVFDSLLRLLEAGDSSARSCAVLAGISGIDHCRQRDRVKRYRDWLLKYAGKPMTSWFLNALANANLKTSLRATDLVSGASKATVLEICRLIDLSKERDWPVRVLACNVLRDITGKDFGTIQQRSNPGARQVVTERYRQWANVEGR